MFSRLKNLVNSSSTPELTPEEQEDNTLAMSRYFGYPGQYRTIKQIKKDSIEAGKIEARKKGEIPQFTACSRFKEENKDNPVLQSDADYLARRNGIFVGGIHLYPLTDGMPGVDFGKCYVYPQSSQGGGKNSISRIKKNKYKRKSHKRKSHKRKNKSKRKSHKRTKKRR